jgi:putative effector of murein hydrolase
MLRTLVGLAAVVAFGVVLSVALVIFGQQLSGRRTARWLRAVLVAALTIVAVLAAFETVTR